MYTINYYSIKGRPRGGLVRGNIGWKSALDDLYKAPRAARVAVVEMDGETRRYERTVCNGWKRTV